MASCSSADYPGDSEDKQNDIVAFSFNMNVLRKTFEKEIVMCQKLSKKNGGKCNWGECKKCGVIPLLYKLFEGKNYEEKHELKELRRMIFK